MPKTLRERIFIEKRSQFGVSGRVITVPELDSGHDIGKLPVRRYHVNPSQVTGNVNLVLRKEVWAGIVSLNHLHL